VAHVKKKKFASFSRCDRSRKHGAGAPLASGPALILLVLVLLVLFPVAGDAAPAPPTVTTSFTPAIIHNNGVSTLTLTLANPAGNAVSLTGVALSDTLVSSGNVMQLDETPDLVNSCGGTVTGAVAGSTGIAVSGVTLAPGQSCSVSVQVTAPAGVYPNTTSAISSDNGGTGLSASATLSVAHPGIQKSFTPSSIPLGGMAQLTITLINPTYDSLTGATFTDAFPAGMVVASPVNLNNGCDGAVYRTGSTAPLAPGDSSLTLVGGSIPKRKGNENANIPEKKKSANGSCSITLNVTASATATNVIPAYPSANQLQVDGPDYNRIPAQATLQILPPPPNIMVLKTVQNHWDPVNGTVNARAIPGGQMLYTLLVANSGAGSSDADSIVITDPIPLQSSLLVAANPVSFADGSPASGLSFTWGGLASLTDDVQFSNNGGITFDYIPTADANGADQAVTHLRITPRGSFSPSDGSNNPNFNLTFKVIIN